MMITLELYELKNICFEMSQLGAASYANQVTPEKDALSQRQAYKAYGESRVKHWVQAGDSLCEEWIYISIKNPLFKIRDTFLGVRHQNGSNY